MTFSFTADAAGSKDPCTIPKGAKFGNFHRLTLRPPQGHSWSYAKPNAGSTSVSVGMDEVVTFEQKAQFYDDEIPVYVALETGSGTFTASLE